MKTILAAIIVFTLFTGFVMAEDEVATAMWHGFNISGEDDYETPGEPIFTIYDTYTDKTGTYTDVLKLEPPEGWYNPSSIAMIYTVPNDGYYKISMWVWADKRENEDIYIEFEQVGGSWETVTGSTDVPVPFSEGQWLYIATESKDGFFLNAGEKFGLLTQSGEKPWIGLNGQTIYIRDIKVEEVPISGWKVFSSALNGLSIMLNFGIRNVNEANDGKREPYIYSGLSYDNSFFKDAFYIWTELGFTSGLYNVENEDGDNTHPVDMYLDVYARYRLNFNNSSLSFMLGDEMDPYVINPRFNSGRRNIDNTLTPGLVYRQLLDNFGTLSAQVEVPIYHYYYWDDNTDSMVYIQYRLGWNSQFGLGIWAREDQILVGDKWEWAVPGHSSINFGLSYYTSSWDANTEISIPLPRYGSIVSTTNININPIILNKVNVGSFSLKIEASFPREEARDERGVIHLDLTPRYEYTIIKGFSVWVQCVIYEIARKDRDVYFTPSLGVVYRF